MEGVRWKGKITLILVIFILIFCFIVLGLGVLGKRLSFDNDFLLQRFRGRQELSIIRKRVGDNLQAKKKKISVSKKENEK